MNNNIEMVKLSEQSSLILPQPMFSIMQMANGLEKKGRKIIHMEVGGTSGFSNNSFLDVFKELAQTPNLNYCASAGTFELRSFLAESYSKEKKTNYKYENVAIAPGNLLINQILTVLCDKGDNVLIPDPGFPTYNLACDFQQLNKIKYELKESNDWNPNLSEIKEIIKNQDIKVAFLNTPSNPLGSLIDKGIINEFLELMNKNNIYVIFDETYKNIIHNKEIQEYNHFSNVLYLYSFSKDTAIPGIRLGALIGDAMIINKVNEYSSLLYSCLSPFFQDVLLSYLKLNDNFRYKMKDDLILRKEEIKKILNKTKLITYNDPSAAFFYFINVEKLNMSGEEFAYMLLEKAGVCVCPGKAFGNNGVNHVRVTFSGPYEEVMQGFEKISAFTNNLII